MRQSRLMSLVEAVANVVVRYGIALLVQIVTFPVACRRSTACTTCRGIRSATSPSAKAASWPRRTISP